MMVAVDKNTFSLVGDIPSLLDRAAGATIQPVPEDKAAADVLGVRNAQVRSSTARLYGVLVHVHLTCEVQQQSVSCSGPAGLPIMQSSDHHCIRVAVCKPYSTSTACVLTVASGVRSHT